MSFFAAPAADTAASVLDDQDVLYTRKEAAVYLKVSIPTLERWAREGKQSE